MLNDTDQENPVDCTSEEWKEIYEEMDDFEDYLDHDYSMNY